MDENIVIPPPTPLARRFVRSVLGFGLGIGIGLAPFLGKVPGFDSLLRLYPEDIRSTLIPFSALLMGIVAAAVQYYAGEGIGRTTLRHRFRMSLIGLLVGLFLLFVLYSLLVERVPIKGGRASVPVVIAWSLRTAACGCPKEMGDIQCIEQLTFAQPAIEACWGSRPLKVSRLVLSLSYLLVTGGFGALIGLLLIREESRHRRQARSVSRPSSPRRPTA